MTAAVWVALAVGLLGGAAAGQVIAAIAARRAATEARTHEHERWLREQQHDHERWLRQQQVEAYAEFVAAVTDFVAHRDRPVDQQQRFLQLLTTEARVVLVAPEPTVDKAVEVVMACFDNVDLDDPVAKEAYVQRVWDVRGELQQLQRADVRDRR